MTCYHTTDAADEIRRNGFRDTTGLYGYVNDELTGVWPDDRPIDIKEGADRDQVLRVELPDYVDLGDLEAFEDGKLYREWCATAAVMDEHPTMTLMTGDQLWEIEANIWRGYDNPNPPGAKLPQQIRTPQPQPPRPVCVDTPPVWRSPQLSTAVEWKLSRSALCTAQPQMKKRPDCSLPAGSLLFGWGNA